MPPLVLAPAGRPIVDLTLVWQAGLEQPDGRKLMDVNVSSISWTVKKNRAGSNTGTLSPSLSRTRPKSASERPHPAPVSEGQVLQRVEVSSPLTGNGPNPLIGPPKSIRAKSSWNFMPA
jgi:hypothetical protein